MIIITKSAPPQEKKYYKCACSKCGTEFVFSEEDTVSFLDGQFAYIRCPYPKCNKIFNYVEFSSIPESEYRKYLEPKHKLRPNTSNPNVNANI